jgi:UDP-N-acetylmuramate dehydrogenase
MTTLGVGGEARYFLHATDEETLRGAIAWARQQGVPLVLLGGGSNMLVADRGIDGLVVRVGLRGVDAREDGDIAIVRAAAGEAWDPMVERAVSSGWAGIECLSGIPGDVGATPIQNVGAYGQEVGETITSVRALDRATGEAAVFDRDACGFGYRDSVFKREARDRFVVVEVTFALRRGGEPSLRYPELARQIDKELAGAAASLADVRRIVIALRRAKSMVLDPADENRRSAGSFFMNPTLEPPEAEKARDRVAAAGVLQSGERMPEYPAAGGRVKLSAAWLIERSGLVKGTHEGAVGISTRHSLALVNRGGATAEEIVAFARRVRGRVEERFGVRLVPEPVLLGFTPAEIAGLIGD